MIFNQAKRKSPTNYSGWAFSYGDGGSWTRVQRPWYISFYVCSSFLNFAWMMVMNEPSSPC